MKVMLGLATLMFILGGCGQPTVTKGAPPPDKVAETSKAADEADKTADDLMAKLADMPIAKPTYTQDEKAASGAVRGVCRIVGAKDLQVAARRAVDLAGAGAIREPQKAEIEYYQNLKLTEHCGPASWLKADPTQKFLVTGVALYFRNIKSGRRAALPRPAFSIMRGTINCQRTTGQGLTHINFAALHERIQFSTGDAYPCQVVLSQMATGTALFEGVASAYEDSDLKAGRPTDPAKFRPRLAQSPPVQEGGQYAVTCKRHPWQKAYLIVTDNPYAMESDGEFTFNDVPAGKQTLEVWHPEFEPVQKTLELEIKADETLELTVDFKPPALAVQEKK